MILVERWGILENDSVDFIKTRIFPSASDKNKILVLLKCYLLADSRPLSERYPYFRILALLTTILFT